MANTSKPQSSSDKTSASSDKRGATDNPTASAEKPSGGKIYVARESGTAEIDGTAYPFTAGVTRVREGHALLKGGRDQLFEEIDLSVHYDIEQATAGPGEKRGS